MQYESALPIEYITDSKKRTEVLQIVSELPINQRLALLIYFYGGLSISEIALSMKMPAWVTTIYLNRACKNVLRELDMTDMSITPSDESTDISILKNVFDWYAEKYIADEQVRRVLEPVLKMIEEGKFDVPRWRSYLWLIKPFVMVAFVATMIIMVAT